MAAQSPHNLVVRRLLLAQIATTIILPGFCVSCVSILRCQIGTENPAFVLLGRGNQAGTNSAYFCADIYKRENAKRGGSVWRVHTGSVSNMGNAIADLGPKEYND